MFLTRLTRSLPVMAEITARRQGEMLKTLFEILSAEDEGLQAKVAIERVQQALPPTEFERSTFPKNPGSVRYPKILRFATINTVKAGWLRKQRGTWLLTDEGRKALKELVDPEDLYLESRRLYRAWKADRDAAVTDLGDGNEPAEDSETDSSVLAASSIEEAEETTRESIQSYLGEMNPYDFQDLVGALIVAMGYHLVWMAPKGPDGGLDFLAQGDPLGVNGPRIKGQVKKRAENKVSREELQAFLSLIENHDVGVYFSLGGFSSKAEELARNNSRRITLIDGNGLIDLWIEHYAELDEDGRDFLRLKPIYFLDQD